jgi:cobalt/nickel transport system permease protein
MTFAFILSTLLLKDGAWVAIGASLLVVITFSYLAGFGWWFVFKRSLIAFPFALAAVTVLFTIPGEPIFSLKIGTRHVLVSEAGMIRFFSIMMRSWLSVQMAILLTATTQFPDIAHGLRHLRMPAVITTIVLFMYRYLFVLGEEAQRLMRARTARSARLPAQRGSSIWWRAKVAGYMVGQLLVRSFDRSERIYNAMLARGYRGEFLTIKPHEMESRDWLFGGVILMIIVIIQIIGAIRF